MTDKEFIAQLAPFAVEEMRRSKIPASLTISQAALESSWGGSGLTTKANNLFGMKGRGPAGSITMLTTEYVNGRAIQVPAAFRAYHNWGESVADHSQVIRSGVSWNRELYRKVIGADGRTAAREIAAAGYATDPGYAGKLIHIMDTYNLYQYDTVVEEEEEMSAEDKQKLARLETEMAEIRLLLAGLSDSRDVLKSGAQEQGTLMKKMAERLTALEGRTAMNIPAWAEPAVQAAVAAGLLDTPSPASYDFYRMLTVLHRAGLITKGKEVNPT